MQINKNSTIAGVSANTIRKILRAADPSVDLAAVAASITWNADRFRNLMLELSGIGYFAVVGGEFVISEEGRAVRNAKWVDQPTRSMAEKLLTRVVETAKTINTLPDFSHYVDEMYVVGSFLEEGDEIKKLEFVVRLKAYSDEELTSRRDGGRTLHGAEDILRLLRHHGKHVVVRLGGDTSESIGRKVVFAHATVA